MGVGILKHDRSNLAKRNPNYDMVKCSSTTSKRRHAHLHGTCQALTSARREGLGEELWEPGYDLVQLREQVVVSTGRGLRPSLTKDPEGLNPHSRYPRGLVLGLPLGLGQHAKAGPSRKNSQQSLAKDTAVTLARGICACIGSRFDLICWEGDTQLVITTEGGLLG